MKAQDIKMIYADPFTEKIEEGLTRLIRKRGEDKQDNMEVWEVEFVDDGFKCLRQIKA